MQLQSVDTGRSSKQLKHNVIYIVLFLMLPIFFLSLIASLYYDDSSFSASLYNHIGIKHISLHSMWNIAKSMYSYHGRIGHMFIHLFIHFSFLYAILVSVLLPMLLSGIPFLFIHKRFPTEKYDLLYMTLYFSISSIIMLLFPSYFFILTDWTNKTMGLSFGISLTLYFLFIALLWLQLIEKINILPNTNSIVILIAFSLGLFSPIHNEFITLYSNGLIIGVLFCAFIFQKKIFRILKNSYALLGFYIGNIIGTSVILTSTGFLQNLLNKGSYSRGSYNSIVRLLVQEVAPLALILIILICIIFGISMILTKKEDKKELLSKDIALTFYFMCGFLGFVLICLITKIPYMRTMVIAAGIIPLVYLLLYWITQIIQILHSKKINIALFIICFGTIFYNFYVTYYNIQSIFSVQLYVMDLINEANKNKQDKLIIPPYKIDFKNHFNAFSTTSYRTSEMGHAFLGTDQEAQDYGLRIVFHPLTYLNAQGPSQWTVGFFGYSGKIDIENSKLAPSVQIPRASLMKMIEYQLKYNL